MQWQNICYVVGVRMIICVCSMHLNFFSFCKVVLITLAYGEPLFERVMSTLARVMGSIFWKKLIRKVYGYFCDVKTRICETPVLRKEFRMIGTTISSDQRSRTT